MAAAVLSKGSRVWVHRGDEGWRRGTVAGASGGSLRVALDCQQLGEAAGPEVAVPADAVEPANPALLDGVRCAACRHRRLAVVTTRLHAPVWCAPAPRAG